MEKVWEKEEEEFLIRNFGVMEIFYMAMNLGRTVMGVVAKIKHMGLYKVKNDLFERIDEIEELMMDGVIDEDLVRQRNILLIKANRR